MQLELVGRETRTRKLDFQLSEFKERDFFKYALHLLVIIGITAASGYIIYKMLQA